MVIVPAVLESTLIFKVTLDDNRFSCPSKHMFEVTMVMNDNCVDVRIRLCAEAFWQRKLSTIWNLACNRDLMQLELP